MIWVVVSLIAEALSVFFVYVVCHVRGGMDFDAVGEIGFRERKCRPMGWSAFEVAEEVELFLVVTVVWIFSFCKNE